MQVIYHIFIVSYIKVVVKQYTVLRVKKSPGNKKKVGFFITKKILPTRYNSNCERNNLPI